MKNNINKVASIMLVAIILSTSIMILFLTVYSLSRQYQGQWWKLEYWSIAQYAAESGAERAIVKYFEKSEILYKKISDWVLTWTWRRIDVIYSVINNSENSDFWMTDINYPSESLITNVLIDKIWVAKVTATRLIDSLETKIPPFSSYEFRLTAEEREKKANWDQNNIKQIQLTWSLPNWEINDAWLEVIQARFPIGQPWNIQTHRLQFNNWWIFKFWDLWDLQVPQKAVFNLPSDTEYKVWDSLLKYEYIFVFKAMVYPIVLKIEWYDSNWNLVQLPDRFVYFNSEAILWWDENSLWWENDDSVFTKKISTKKEIYTNFDSNFDYSRNFMNF